MRNNLRRIALVGLGMAALLAGCRPPGDGEAGVPEEVVRLNILGTSLLSQQKWDEARERFQAALEIRPDDPNLLVNVAVTLIQQSREEEAETYLRRAVSADPRHRHAHYDLGLIEKNNGNLEEAARHLAVVVEADPDEVAARYNLASVLTRLERLDEAEALYRAALERNPTHVSSLYGLGRLLLQQGRQEEGIELVSRSQQIRSESGIDAAMGNQYGEQGPYAMGVDYPGGGLAAPAAIPVTLRVVDAPLAPGLVVAAAMANAGTSDSDLPGIRVASIAVGDVNGDRTLERVVLEQSGDDDGWFVRVLAGGEEGGAGEISREAIDFGAGAGWSDARTVLVDRDHDGDLDLFGCIAGGADGACFIADNDGSGNFEIVTDETGIDPGPLPDASVHVAFFDFDNDRDVDLVVVEPGGVHLYSNLRDGTFEDVSEAAGLGGSVAGAGGVAVADLDKNLFMDLVVGTPEGPVLLLNDRGRFTADRHLATGDGAGAAGAVVFDYDNDGFLDLASVIDGRLRLFRNSGLGNFEDTSRTVLGSDGVERWIPLLAIDLDDDGDLDLLAHDGSGGGAALRNEGGNANNWISVRPEGVADNSSGIGTKIEVLAGALRQKFEIFEPVPVHAGLGRREGADAVRFLWPGGVLQDELEIPACEPIDVAQLDRKGTSCPLLYAWRDGAWRFVTDFLGGCAIGYRHSRDSLNVPDTDEYVLVEGGLTDEDGTVRLRLNNQLEEVIWFDRAELVVVDHPQEAQVYPDERLMPGPPWPEFRLFASPDVRAIGSARDVDRGLDVTATLRDRDRRFVEGFPLLPFKGYAEMHTLELGLGDLPPDERVVLLLDGWIDYADSTANIAASHAGAVLVPPRLLVPDGSGGWNEIGGRMGFPAGLPKTMAVDLTGALPTGDARVRISTTMRIYWDRARVMVGGESTPTRVTRIRAREAELRFGGFPAETSPDGKAPFAYDPEDVATVSPWKTHAGAYTAFGEVTTLISGSDDRFVTTRNGDEIELRFDIPAPPPEGWRRTYLLFADGFGKDMDPNSAASSRVGPIPFHGMPVYPYAPGVVRPPAVEEAPARIVLEPADGLPGAVPLALKGEDRKR